MPQPAPGSAASDTRSVWTLRTKGHTGPEGTKPPANLAAGASDRCQALSATLCSTTPGFPSARTWLHRRGYVPTSLYSTAHPQFRSFIAWSPVRAMTVSLGCPRRTTIQHRGCQSPPPCPPSCQGHPWRCPLPQTLPVSGGSHKTWHRPPNRCFLNTILRRQCDSTSNTKTAPSHSFWRNKGLCFGPSRVCALFLDSRVLDLQTSSSCPSPYSLQVFHSVSVQTEHSLESTVLYQCLSNVPVGSAGSPPARSSPGRPVNLLFCAGELLTLAHLWVHIFPIHCPPLSVLRGMQALHQPGPREPLWVF